MSSFFTINLYLVNLENQKKPRLNLGFLYLALTLHYFLFFGAKKNILKPVAATAAAPLQKF